MPHSHHHGEGKTLWVTGASGGLGPGICRLLGKAGYQLGMHAWKNVDAARKIAIELTRMGVNVTVTSGDLTEPGIAGQAFNHVRELLGTPYGVIHLAGPYAQGKVAEFSRDSFERMLSGNLTTLFEVIRVAVPAMREAGGGRIIATGMVGAHQTVPMRLNGPHLAAKAGVAALIRTLALEEAPHNITANVINPGNITEKSLDRTSARSTKAKATHPMGVHGSYEDLADAMLYLLSDGASYVTGAVLEVTGGWMNRDMSFD
ncbi:MAG: SDR family NAD(P)-dependent oxidoreductase [bacterium]